MERKARRAVVVVAGTRHRAEVVFQSTGGGARALASEPRPEAEAVRRASAFAGDVARLASGTSLAQLLTVAATPALTRLYDPQAFGVLALFAALTGLVGVVACLRYEQAIVLPESDVEAANLLVASVASAVAVSAFTLAVVWWGGPSLLALVRAAELGPYLWLAPPAVFASGAFLALGCWCSRTRRFGGLAVARTTGAALAAGFQLLAGSAGHATGGSLAGGVVFGSALSVSLLGLAIYRRDGPLILRSTTWRGMLGASRRYARFPLYGSWSALLNALSTMAPALLLALCFSPATVGYYSLGKRLLGLPTSLLGSSVGQVFYQRAADAQARGRSDELRTVVEDVLGRLVSYGLLPVLLLVLTGPELFALAFGDQWAEAGVYVRILGPWTLLVFVGSPISNLLNVLDRQGAGLLFNVCLLASRVVALLLGGVAGDARLALALFAATGVAAWTWLSLWLATGAGVPPSRAVRSLAPRVAACLLFAGPTFIGSVVAPSHPALTIAVAGVSALAYYAVAVRRDEAVWLPVRSLVSGLRQAARTRGR